VERLQRLLQDNETRPLAVDSLWALIQAIEIYPAAERGYCEVILRGGLAQILDFAQKTPAASGADGGTFLVVAGVGFEPTTFRL
jgi:site-specific DNA recombinase